MNIPKKAAGILKSQLNLWTNRTYVLPFVLLNITSDCNSRCIMCGFGRDLKKQQLTVADIKGIARAAKILKIRNFIISGGEPLLHPELAKIARILGETGAKLSLASNGLILEEHAYLIAGLFATVFVSWDGSCQETYEKIRGVDALARVKAGVKKLKTLKPSILVIARNVVQKANYADLAKLTIAARDLGMNHISFSPADVTNAAFGRSGQLPAGVLENILLDGNDLAGFKKIIFDLRASQPQLFSSKFIIEGFKNLLRIYNYYAAQSGKNKFPPAVCNLPWLYAVVEADGQLKPCCLYSSVGSIRQERLEELVRGEMMIKSRNKIRHSQSLVCSRCAYASSRVHLKMLSKIF